LDALPQKAEKLFSQSIEEVIDAATFFRKVLATGEFARVTSVMCSAINLSPFIIFTVQISFLQSTSW
jgi:hypothetical protein